MMPETPLRMPAINRITGDSLLVLPGLDNYQFDLLLTDPPYAMPATYYEGRGGAKRRWSDSSILTGWFRGFMEKCAPCMKPNAMFAVFANGAAAAAFWPVLFECSTHLQMAVWDKESFGMGKPLRNQCEFIIVGAFGTPYISRADVSNLFRCPRVPSAQRSHQAQKPLALIEELAAALCPPGGHVLDPFAGSRVCETAATRLGLDCTTIEYDDPELTPLFPVEVQQ